MKLLLCIVVSGPMALTGCAQADRPADVPVRSVAFDNVYGQVDRLPVHVAVDSGVEQPHTAACDTRTCTFKLPLTNGLHKLTISVEQNGRRSAPVVVTVDTSNLR